MVDNLQAIVLAAGKSTRLNTGNTKLIEKMCGQELILYPTRLLASLNIPTTVVIGYQKRAVRNTIVKEHGNNINFVEQEKQHGTGHAILCARDKWEKQHVLIMNGDTPLVTAEIIEQLYDKHIETKANISFVTSHDSTPISLSYDRVIQTKKSIDIIRSEEFKGETADFSCIDAGIYIVSKKFIEAHTADIDHESPRMSFHLSDLVQVAIQHKETVTTVPAPFDRVRGINTFQELWSAEHVKRSELIRHWMGKGVRFSAAQSVHLDLNVDLGAGTFVGCGVHLTGRTKIGKNVYISPFSVIEDSIIEDGSTIHPYSVITNSKIGPSNTIGPFAHVWDKTNTGAHATIGNFVEVTRSKIGNHTKAKHLSYLGDAEVGARGLLYFVARWDNSLSNMLSSAIVLE